MLREDRTNYMTILGFSFYEKQKLIEADEAEIKQEKITNEDQRFLNGIVQEEE